MKKSVKPKRRLLVLGTLSIVLIFSCFYTLGTYVYDYFYLQAESENLTNELTSLQKDKETLKNDLIKLQDEEYIIRYAKENFLYSEDGEYILKLDIKQDDTELVTASNPYQFAIFIGGISLVIITILIVFKSKPKEKTSN